MTNQHREKYDSVDLAANTDMKNESADRASETTHRYTEFSFIASANLIVDSR